MNKHYTVDEIADMLTLHPKTVQRYIREGKIKAHKVGKRWCVPEYELKRFTGSVEDLPDRPQAERSKVSAVADLIVRDSEEAARMEKTLIAMLNGKPDQQENSAMHIQYLEYEGNVRITLWGSLAFVRDVLDAVAVLIEQKE